MNKLIPHYGIQIFTFHVPVKGEKKTRITILELCKSGKVRKLLAADKERNGIHQPLNSRIKLTR